MPENGYATSVVGELLPRTSTQKLTAGNFTVPQMNRVLENGNFVRALTSEERDYLQAILEAIRHDSVSSDIVVAHEKKLLIK